MSIVIFWLLAGIAAVPIVLPLLPGRREADAGDLEIERAVQLLREARRKTGPRCPSCGEAYQPGDSYCAGCGEELPRAEQGAGPAGVVRRCPSCQAPLRETDRFCSQCAQPVPGREAK